MLNDKDMDLLIRRFAKGAAPNAPVEHPDADELNAFAEGALPAAARQRYVSHFADCDDCRKLVSELAATAGATAEARIPASEPLADPWWRKLGLLFSPAALRYAAFAVVLLAVVGVAFVVWRRPVSERNAELIAQHQPQANPVEATKPSNNQAPETGLSKTMAPATTGVPQATPPATAPVTKSIDSLDASPPAPPPAKPADVMAAKEPSSSIVGGAAKSGETVRAESSPSYAPAPPTMYDRSNQDNRAREQQNVGAIPGGPRRNESYDKYKNVDRSRSVDMAKGRDEDRSVAANQAPVTENKQDDARRQTSSGVLTMRGRADQEKSQARKTESTSDSPEERAEPRSVGGRKFNRQGKAWVDSKFKSSMSVRSVARGSEDFDKLDSGLRSIANQLGGEVVVVWKGKAYRIR